ncbi:PREDICTED: mitochondrial import inner membrane translocase subunit Tim21-like [Priapulus caudatus]|uniref:Mitochondrial import inner membrane translocase subunit Tim21 n=1 Tax=Priapulus caudatus TaxID=37621 RepID=A0ABM1F276_PRICU|nr:PREDICTED: mitochondrial import inner membrane translocase subunit Tim21-like [Priapulus caudatus]XP_014678547.1 PREDICTED: mitochondrial import inner membrane translocase subunit Tim21-like [Priapulus caudatus]XP_014678548.1 PREDICTED: mitochondrial import inner membrane translocase subunit Tim21-like [Priapulus caudatus]
MLRLQAATALRCAWSLHASQRCAGAAALLRQPHPARVIGREESTAPRRKSPGIVKSDGRSGGEVTTSLGEKVKQTSKDLTWIVVIVGGAGIIGLMFYYIFYELFSKDSPTGVYGDALKRCKKNMKVTDVLGEPLKAYGEMSSRGRRRHVSNTVFVERDGTKHMRMRFYVEGSVRKATVHVEMRENDRGKYEYLYLIVELDGYPQRTIVVEDNRGLNLVKV